MKVSIALFVCVLALLPSPDKSWSAVLLALWRRSYVAALCFAPLGCAAASLIVGLRGQRPLPPSPIVVVMALALALAAFIAWLNFYLCFLRFWLYKRRHGTEEGYRWASGVPAIGSFLALAAVLICWGNPWFALASALLLLADMGGLIWFFCAAWQDKTFWHK